jgi:tetratricopeptide (TPR) repeat protein
MLCISPALAKVAARVKGTVRTPEGKPMEGVQVVLIYSVDQGKVALITDKNGRWSTVSLRPGEWLIGFNAEGYRPQTVKVLLSAIKQNKDIDIAMIPIPKAPTAEADGLYNEKKYDKALAEYQKVLKSKPDLDKARERIGLCYYRLGKLPQAISAFEEVLQKDAGNQDALVNLTAIHLEKGDLEKGLAYFNKLDAGSVKDHTIFYNIGILLFGKGEMAKAAVNFKKCIELNPDYAKGHYQLALTLLNQGDMENSKKHFETVIRLAPDSQEAGQSKDMLKALQ